MNESTILNGFITAPSKYNSKFKRPWLNFNGNKIISTNGVSLISIDKELISTVYYYKWDIFSGHEPLMELPATPYDSYFKISENFYNSILTDNKNGTVKLTVNGKIMKFNWRCIVPIFNACKFWEDKGDFFVSFSGIKNPLLIKHESKKIDMAIMPIT